MPRLTDAQRERLRQAVQTHDFLRRIVRRIEALQRLVFHDESLDPRQVRASAEDVLIADIAMRHRENIDGVYYAIRAAEDGGRNWDQAIDDYAGGIHAYYTTPLGILIRRDLFGDAAHFGSRQLADQLARAVSTQAPPPDSPR